MAFLNFILIIYSIFSSIFLVVTFTEPTAFSEFPIIITIRNSMLVFNLLYLILFCLKNDYIENEPLIINKNYVKGGIHSIFNPFSIKNEWKYHYDFFLNWNSLTFSKKCLKLCLYLSFLLPARLHQNIFFVYIPDTTGLALFVLFYYNIIVYLKTKTFLAIIYIVFFIFIHIYLLITYLMLKIFKKNELFFIENKIICYKSLYFFAGNPGKFMQNMFNRWPKIVTTSAAVGVFIGTSTSFS